MRKKITLILIAIALLMFLPSCRNHIEIDYNASIDGTWSSLFDVFWNNMNKNYIMFNLDYDEDKWDRVYDEYSPQFKELGNIERQEKNSENNRAALLLIFNIVKELADGHFSIDIYDENGKPLFDFSTFSYKSYKEDNFSDDEIFIYACWGPLPRRPICPYDEDTPNIAKYTFGIPDSNTADGSSTGKPASNLSTGTLKNGSTYEVERLQSGNLDIILGKIDNEILYLSFSAFGFSNGSEDVKNLIKRYQGYLKDESIKSVIIDLRGNTGGLNDDLSLLWSPMISTDLAFAEIRIKDGPNRNDFSPWSKEDIKGNGDEPFSKPIAVLFNRSSGSCSELSVMIFQQMQKRYGTKVRFFGSGNTAGGTCSQNISSDAEGNIINHLNAGSFLSKPYLDIVNTQDMQRRGLDGKFYEVVGLSPDELIEFNHAYYSNFENGNDNLLFRSIEWIKGQN